MKTKKITAERLIELQKIIGLKFIFEEKEDWTITDNKELETKLKNLANAIREVRELNIFTDFFGI